MFHTFLGERLTDAASCKALVRKIAENTKLPYFSITPTFSICPVHGYIRGEHHTCPLVVDQQPDPIAATVSVPVKASKGGDDEDE